MAIPGIPNSYKGRNYRSLLETRWAIMFEKLGWQAEYEPFELNGWIPDFILIGKEESLLVEVKPFTHLNQYNNAIAKIENSVKETDYEESEVLLLGVNPARECESMPYPMMGWLGEPCRNFMIPPGRPNPLIRHYHEARLWLSDDNESFCLGSSVAAYRDRIHSLDWKNAHNGADEIGIVVDMWADAGSQTQWKASSYSNAKALFNRKMTPIEEDEWRKHLAYAFDNDRIEREMREREKRLDLEEQLLTIKGDNK